MMVGAEELVDRFSGMITKRQAEKLSGDNEISESEKDRRPKKSFDVTNTAGVLEFINMELKSSAPRILVGEEKKEKYLVNIQDYIYRIFNPLSYGSGERNTNKRTAVLGREGLTINLTLRDRISDFIDINVFERGDLVLVKNARIDLVSGGLLGISNTTINKIMPVPFNGTINDYSFLRAGQRNVDVIGKVLEIGPIRYVSRLGGSGQTAVADCVLTDLKDSVNVSMWGSSAIQTAKMNINDILKIEFCNARTRNDRLEIFANDLSRVIANKKFENRLRPR